MPSAACPETALLLQRDGKWLELGQQDRPEAPLRFDSLAPQHLETIVDFYRARWTIEELFKALKTRVISRKGDLKRCLRCSTHSPFSRQSPGNCCGSAPSHAIRLLPMHPPCFDRLNSSFCSATKHAPRARSLRARSVSCDRPAGRTYQEQQRARTARARTWLRTAPRL